MFIIKFRSKVDHFFIWTIGIAILIIAVSTFLPFFIEDDVPVAAAIILISSFIVCTGFILWVSFAVSYEFKDEYLFVKGGPLKSRIRYDEITKVSKTRDIFSGYRMLSARDSIEVFYKSGLMGSVKISPENESQFIAELKKRCPKL